MQSLTPITGIDIARELTLIHHHADEVFTENPEQRVYKEEELIEFLVRIGVTKPDWLAYSKQIDNFSQKLISIDQITHPGKTILVCLSARNMPVSSLIDKLYPSETQVKDREYLAEVLKGKARMTKPLAQLLEQTLQVDKKFWLNRQKLYDKRVMQDLVKSLRDVPPDRF